MTLPKLSPTQPPERAPRAHLPSLELRIPISPTDHDLRMLRYLLESLRLFGGHIARAAHTVVSVSPERPVVDLNDEYPWTRGYSLDFRWVDPGHFRAWSYDATGYDRFWVSSDADIVAFLDLDLLFAGPVDRLVRDAHQSKQMLGFIAHVSPFGFRGLADTPSNVWWDRVFREARLSPPDLDWQHTGWGLDWEAINPRTRIVSNHPEHRRCPSYFNYGVVIGPRNYFEQMGQTFVQELEAVSRVVPEARYYSQIANCLAFQRHDIPCGLMSINYNFPLNLPGQEIRRLNSDPHGHDADDDIRIFHYIGGRGHFRSEEALDALLKRTDLQVPWPTFQQKLREVQHCLSRLDRQAENHQPREA